MKKTLLFFATASSLLFNSCGTKQNESTGTRTDSTKVSQVIADTAKYEAIAVRIDTTETSPEGFAAPPARAGKDALKAWDNVFRGCSMYSQISNYGDFLGVGSVQAVGQEMLKDEYEEVENGVSFDINWFKPDTLTAKNDIFPRGASNSENVITCSGKTGKKVSLNTLLGGKIILPSGLNPKLNADLKAALERKTEQTVDVKWKRKEINVLVLPAYVATKAKDIMTAGIYFDNLFKDDIITLTKGIVVESFKTKVNIDGMTDIGLKAAFDKDSTLSLNGDFKLKIEKNREIFLESSKPFVIRGSFYQFKKRP